MMQLYFEKINSFILCLSGQGKKRGIFTSFSNNKIEEILQYPTKRKG